MNKLPWFLSVLCLLAVAISCWCVCEVQRYNLQAFDEVLQYRLTTQSQADSLNRAIRENEGLIELNRAILDRAKDMKVENFELRKANDEKTLLIEFLLKKLEEFQSFQELKDRVT